MDDASKIALYQQMVAEKIVQHESGMIELPIKALQEYHDAIGLGPEQLCYFGLNLPRAEDGIYNYALGDDLDEDAAVLIMDAFYYDTETGESASLQPHKLLEASIYRRYYNGDAMFCGEMRVDNLGRLWLHAMTEDNIGAQFCVQFSPGSMGYSICSDDLTYVSRMWFDGEKFIFTPTFVFIYHGPPS